MQKNSHEFALFFPSLTSTLTASPALVRIVDDELVGRMTHVLRVQVGQTIVLFDTTTACTGVITQVGKKEVAVNPTTVTKVTPLAPALTLWLPLLKREAFEEVLYAATELGVTTVQPVITSKTSTSWGTEKDMLRAQRIFVAAAEQSKQFALPKLEKAKSLSELLQTSAQESAVGILFD